MARGSLSHWCVEFSTSVNRNVTVPVGNAATGEAYDTTTTAIPPIQPSSYSPPEG